MDEKTKMLNEAGAFCDGGYNSFNKRQIESAEESRNQHIDLLLRLRNMIDAKDTEDISTVDQMLANCNSCYDYISKTAKACAGVCKYLNTFESRGIQDPGIKFESE